MYIVFQLLHSVAMFPQGGEPGGSVTGHANPIFHQATGPGRDRVEQPEFARPIVGRECVGQQRVHQLVDGRSGRLDPPGRGGIPCSIIPRPSGLRRPRRPDLALACLLPGLRERHHARGTAPDRHQRERDCLPPGQTHHLQSPFRHGDRRRRDHPGDRLARRVQESSSNRRDGQGRRDRPGQGLAATCRGQQPGRRGQPRLNNRLPAARAPWSSESAPSPQASRADPPPARASGPRSSTGPPACDTDEATGPPPHGAPRRDHPNPPSLVMRGAISAALLSCRLRLAPAERAAAAVRRDPVEPWAQCAVDPERAGLAGQDQEGRLESVLRLLFVAEHATADAKHHAAVPLNERGECRLGRYFHDVATH